MKFKVIRTSTGGDRKPCNAVHPETYDMIEKRTFTEKFFNEKIAKENNAWRKNGINHTTWERGIQRTFPNHSKGWFIEINSLEELMEFIEKINEPIIIDKCCKNDSIYEIEIYDDYRE